MKFDGIILEIKELDTGIFPFQLHTIRFKTFFIADFEKFLIFGVVSFKKFCGRFEILQIEYSRIEFDSNILIQTFIADV